MKPTDEELEAMAALTADQLAQVIRKVDGENTMGAGALAEAILSALEPAPDHETWNAAIEAAAKVAQSYGCCHVPQEIAEEIRALKKGQTND